MNSLTIAGYLGNDCDVRVSPQGTAIVSFNVPVEQGWGQNKKTTWVRCVMFGKKGTGEPPGLAQYLLKGKFVVVTGELVLNEWQKDGQNHAQVQCITRDVKLGPGTGDINHVPEGAVNAPALEEDDIPFD